MTDIEASTDAPLSAHKRGSARALLVFLVLVVGAGWAIGVTNLPGAWYAGLAKPAFNPPNWVFAPVWTVLYVLIAIAGWRVWTRDRAGWPMKLWAAQLALNWAWSPVFSPAINRAQRSRSFWLCWAPSSRSSPPPGRATAPPPSSSSRTPPGSRSRRR